MVWSGRGSIAQARPSLAMVRAWIGITPNGEWLTATDGPGSDNAAVRRPSSRMNVDTSATTPVQLLPSRTMADSAGS